eukprot:COSAG01_NODE_48_length_31904_cov_21.696997_2_plen_131_part_00
MLGSPAAPSFWRPLMLWEEGPQWQRYYGRRLYMYTVATPCGDPIIHETDRKILKSAQQGYQNPLQYVPEKQSAAAEIERQLRRLVVFPRQRPPSERHSCAEVPVRRRDVRGVQLGPVAADPLYWHIRARW